MAKDDYRPEGRYITAQDVADRLLPDLYIHEVLLWAPDLFAYTSYLLSMTSAYQLVVSPPSKKTWQPEPEEIKKWLQNKASRNLNSWITQAVEDWPPKRQIDIKKKVRDTVNALGTILSELDKEYENLIDERKNDTSKKFPSYWNLLVEKTGQEWQRLLNTLGPEDCDQIDDTYHLGETKPSEDEFKEHRRVRQSELLRIVLTHTPPLLLACWSFFYHEVTRESKEGGKLRITDLLCNRDDHLRNHFYRNRLWNVSQSLLTMHAIADIASAGFGVSESASTAKKAFKFADRLLFGRAKGVYKDQMFFSGGSLSTFNTERVRVLPKRHNPPVGITLRSISSNLAFHQSSVDIVWRKAQNNPLGSRLLIENKTLKTPKTPETISILLFPFPLTVRTKDFREDNSSSKYLSICRDRKKKYFAYDPRFESRRQTEEEIKKTTLDVARKDREKAIKYSVDKSEEIYAERESERICKLIQAANEEHKDDKPVDVIIFPEAALNARTFESIEEKLKGFEKEEERPSLIIAGVRESQSDIVDDKDRPQNDVRDVNFPRNAVYCKYYNSENKNYYTKRDKDNEEIKGYPVPPSPTNPLDWETLRPRYVTPRYKQYKHHRWHLNKSQIQQYGLTSVLETDTEWFESIKIPKRRVSFLNLGDRLTISHLICEDLARQDPIAELIRHVGPSLVVAILMDGPQLRTRWSARYATVLADDPGCSVITLTSIGMAHRHNSQFGLMSRVIGLWNDSTSSNQREIELDYGAEAVLLTVEIGESLESTADGRTEVRATTKLSLQDVIQIYPRPDSTPKKKERKQKNNHKKV